MTTANPAPGRSAPAGADGSFTHRQIMVILAGLMSGMFLAALDQTIVATSIRTIADDLSGLSLQAWATTAYLITATISTPLYGKLSDLYGRRPFFIIAITIFLVGSALSGLSESMYQLAGYRAVQGLGAGGLFSLALAIIGDIVPPRERAKYQGYFLAVFGTSSVLGPVVGGFFAGQETLLGVTGWRWVFLVNIPIGLVALAVVAKSLHLPHVRRDHRLDVPGALALVVALVPLLVVAEQGRTWGWTSGRSLTCYVVGAIGVVAFLLAERSYGDDALLPLRLFRGRTFAVGSALNLIIGMGMFGGLAMLPLYLQIVKGVTPTEAGLLLLPLTFGIMTGSIFSGQFISRTGRYKIFPVVGTGLLVVALVLLSRVSADTPLGVVMAISALFGLGLGGNMQPLVLAIQNAVPPQDMGVATSSATFFRQMGGTLGTAVFLSILFGTVGGNIGTRLGEAAQSDAFRAAAANPTGDPASNAVITDLLGGSGSTSGALDDSSFLNTADPTLAKPFLQGFADSMDLVFVLGAAVVAVAFLLVFFLPEEKLRTQSGIQARQSADEDAAASSAAAPTSVAPVSADAAASDGASSNGASSDGASSDGVGDRPARRHGRHVATPVD